MMMVGYWSIKTELGHRQFMVGDVSSCVALIVPSAGRCQMLRNPYNVGEFGDQ